MNNSSFASRLRRRLALTVAGACLAGLVAGTALHAARSSDDHPSIAFRVDDAPINRGGPAPASYADVAKRVSPCVVRITVRIQEGQGEDQDQGGQPDQGWGQLPDPFRQFFGFGPMQPQAPQVETGLGSGVIVTRDGYIVTNNHVVDHADHVSVALADGRTFTAKVVGRDPKTDVAVVKVDAHDLPAITFADSSKIEVGDRVLAVGNPFGIGETVTSGIVSATGRRPGLGIQYEDFIQTDAAINPGNSGGALVDIDGRLIGLNAAIYSRSGGFQGVGFAVPSDLVRKIAMDLVETGKVNRSMIGVEVQDLTPALAENFGIKEGTAGALVTDVQPGSPAAKAGIKSGDVITAVNEAPVTDATGLSLTVSEVAPGTRLHLDLLRNGHTEHVSVTTVRMGGGNGMSEEEAAGNGGENNQGVLNGVTVTDLDASARQQFNIPERIRGALITEVAPNSASALAGLEPGDVILEINHHRVTSADEAVQLSQNATSKKTLLKLWSHGGMIYTLVDESGGGGS